MPCPNIHGSFASSNYAKTYSWFGERLAVAKDVTSSNKRRRDSCGIENLPQDVLVHIISGIINKNFTRSQDKEDYEEHEERTLTVGRLNLVSKLFQRADAIRKESPVAEVLRTRANYITSYGRGTGALWKPGERGEMVPFVDATGIERLGDPWGLLEKIYALYNAERKRLTIKFRVDNANEITFKLRMSTGLARVINHIRDIHICQNRFRRQVIWWEAGPLDVFHGHDASHQDYILAFLFKGNRIMVNQTPSDLGMVDGDVIDVVYHQMPPDDEDDDESDEDDVEVEELAEVGDVAA